MHQIKIRRTEIQDLESVYGFLCELENERFNFNAFSQIFHKNIHNSEYAYFTASDGNKAIGYISFHIQALLHHCGMVGEIQELFIDKNYRNRGIGKLLISEIEKISEINDLKSIEVTSNISRIENVEIYKKLGFRLTHNKFTK